MAILTGTGILDGTGILSGRGILFQSGILVPPLVSLDPDAAAYIAAVEAAGATVTGAQRTAINTFYVDAKAEGYYSSLKRLYLPIWGVAAANAIDMITGASGTFNGGVTHGAGFVQGNGSTGYFDMGVSASTLGLNESTGLIMALVKTAPSGTGFKAHVSSFDNASARTQLYVGGDNVDSLQANGSSVTHSGVRATNTGIYVSSRESTTSIELFSRKTSGLVKHSTNSASSAGGSASSLNMQAMAQDMSIYSDGEYGSYGLGLGLSDLLVESFTLHLKTLWEGCTGLTLP